MSSPLIPGPASSTSLEATTGRGRQPTGSWCTRTAPYPDGSRTEAAGANWRSKEGGKDFGAASGRARLDVERRAGRWRIGWFKVHGSDWGRSVVPAQSNVILVVVVVQEQAGGAPAAPRRVVVVARRLLDGSMPRLLHCRKERNAAIGRFGQNPDHSPCAEISRGSNPAIATLCLSMLVASSQAFNASTGRAVR